MTLPGGQGQPRSKSERLAEFLRRIGAAPPVTDADKAFRQLCDMLDEVEDEMSGTPNNPANWQVDGRMYPPQEDRRIAVPGCPNVRGYRSRGHDTFIGDNGAIEIRDRFSGSILFTKPGADGKGV